MSPVPPQALAAATAKFTHSLGLMGAEWTAFYAPLIEGAILAALNAWPPVNQHVVGIVDVQPEPRGDKA